MTPATYDKKPVLFRLYTMINMADVKDLIDKDNKNLHVSVLDVWTLLQNFNGYTPFQIFQSNSKFFTYLYDKIKEENIAD